MTWLLDTNVLSETTRTAPNAAVMQWLRDVDEDESFLSVLTLGELRSGIQRLPAGRRRDQLERFVVDDIPRRFLGRVLSVTPLVADRWGELTARARANGRHAHVVDTLIAATALVGGHTVVTRDNADFDDHGVRVLNPWDG